MDTVAITYLELNQLILDLLLYAFDPAEMTDKSPGLGYFP